MFSAVSLFLPFIYQLAELVIASASISLRSHAALYFCPSAAALDAAVRKIRAFVLAQTLCAAAALACALLGAQMSEDPIYATLAATLWALYAFMLLNFCYVFYLLSRAAKAAKAARGGVAQSSPSAAPQALSDGNETLAIIVYYFAPLNALMVCAAMLLRLSLDLII